MKTIFRPSFGRASRVLAVLVLAVFAPTAPAPAAAPQAINYQAIARKPDGTPIGNQAVKIRATIRQAAVNGAIVYQETLNTATSAGGQFAVKLGTGTPVQGSFLTIPWGDFTHFLQIEIDPTGGNSFTDMGTQQFVSVPYAQHAATSQATDAVGGTSGRIAKFGPTGTTVVNSGIVEVGGFAGINESAPIYFLDVGGTVRAQTNLRSDGGVIAQGSMSALGSVTAGTSVNAATANISGDADVGGVVTVKSGRGIVRSNTATQQKIVRTSGNFAVNLPSNTFVDSGDLNYEDFGGVPTVIVGQCTNPGGEWYKLQLLPINVTATKCQIRLFNPASDTVTVPAGTTWFFLIVGPE